MKIHDFTTLPFPQQLKHTQGQGTFLTVIRMSDHVVKLYALGRFYVEIWYNTESDSMDITAFDNTEWLAAYIPNIDIAI